MKVGLGIIGTGWWGDTLAVSAVETGKVRIAACYARTESARDAFATRHACASAPTLDALLNDSEVQGIVIATSHSSHLPLIEQAADAGKPIFVEKPLTLTVGEAQKVVEIVRSTGLHLQVGHQRRRTAANRKIKEMIDTGKLGPIQAVEANQSVPKALSHTPDSWRRDRAESPLGGMASLAVHKIDTMHYLVGPMKRVFTFTKNTMDEPPIDEATVIAIEFHNGAVGTLITSFVVPAISQISVFAIGASAHNVADGTRLLTQTEGADQTEVPLDSVDPVIDQLTEFAAVIRGEAIPETGPAQGAAVVAAMDAMITSAATGVPVDVDYGWTGWSPQ